jgi:TPR repeat protein
LTSLAAIRRLAPTISQTLWDSAQRGDSDAQYQIGTIYASGNGVPQDYAESYFWLDLAASAEVGQASRERLVKARDEATSHLTPTVLLDTQKRAREWFDEHDKDATRPTQQTNGVYRIGDRVSKPVLIHSVEAEYTVEARKAKYQGDCLISLVVDEHGNRQNIRVAFAGHGIG